MAEIDFDSLTIQTGATGPLPTRADLIWQWQQSVLKGQRASVQGGKQAGKAEEIRATVAALQAEHQALGLGKVGRKVVIRQLTGDRGTKAGRDFVGLNLTDGPSRKVRRDAAKLHKTATRKIRIAGSKLRERWIREAFVERWTRPASELRDEMQRWGD